MIPPVEERQIRPCFGYNDLDETACIFAVADEQAETCSMLEWLGGEPKQWHNRISELRQPKCKYHITQVEIKELIDQHNSGELPEWLKERLKETIIDCELLCNELIDDGDIEESVVYARKATVLRWILSLRKEDSA